MKLELLKDEAVENIRKMIEGDCQMNENEKQYKDKVMVIFLITCQDDILKQMLLS